MPTDREPRAASTAAAKKLSPQSSTKPLPQVVEKKQQIKSSSTKRAHPTYQDMIIVSLSYSQTSLLGRVTASGKRMISLPHNG